MGESSTGGALVPTTASKSEPDATSAQPPIPIPPPSAADEPVACPSDAFDVDKDMLCPICMQIIKDAFLTACGHSFCYTCIMTHLQNKNDCPCCGHYLTNSRIFPNFLLNKVNFFFPLLFRSLFGC